MSTAPTPNPRLDALAEKAHALRSETQALLDKLTSEARVSEMQHSIWKTELLLAMARELEVSSDFFVECSINAINEAKAVRGSHAELERRLAALEAQEVPMDTPKSSTRFNSVSRVPLWPHEELADDEVFLGTWVDPDTRRPLDLYFRPKPKDTANGFCDAIIARWGGYKNDVRVGPADVFSLAELGVHGDDVQRAMRVGHLMLVDRGLIPPPMVASHVFGERFQVQFCTGPDPEGEEGWVPALVDPRPSTFNTQAAADELRTLLKSRGVDETRLRVYFTYGLDRLG